MLKGNGKGNFSIIEYSKSGLIIDGDVKDVKSINLFNGQKLIIAAVNGEKLKCFYYGAIKRSFNLKN